MNEKEQLEIREVSRGWLLIESSESEGTLCVTLDGAADIYNYLHHFISVGVRCECGFNSSCIHGQFFTCPSCNKQTLANKDFCTDAIRYRSNGDGTRYNVCRVCKAEFDQDSDITSLCSKHRG